MEFRDSFGRTIDYIRISVTDRCNLRCIYCMPREVPKCSKPSEVLDRDGIIGILRIARKYGLRKVRFTGGEPLLRQDIAEIVGAVKDLGVEDISLTTNGLLLPQMAGRLKEAGLDRVNISMDSMDPERYGRITGGGSLETVLRAIDEAGNAGLAPVKINVIPIRGVNEDEISSFAALTVEKPYHIRFIELMPVGNETFSGERRITASQVLEHISAAGKTVPLGRTGSATNYRLEGAKGTIGLISPVSNHFCDSCNRLRVTARGTIKPCLFSDQEIDLNKASSGEEKEKMILQAVRQKPKGSLLKKRVPLDAMSQVGG